MNKIAYVFITFVNTWALAQGANIETSTHLLGELNALGGNGFEISILDRCVHPICTLTGPNGAGCVARVIPAKTIQAIHTAFIPILKTANYWMDRIETAKNDGTTAKIDLRVRPDGSWWVTAAVARKPSFQAYVPGFTCNGAPSLPISFGGSQKYRFVTDSNIGFRGNWAEQLVDGLRRHACQVERESSGSIRSNTPGCP